MKKLRGKMKYEGTVTAASSVVRMLNKAVNVVFHCAATVRFDEELTKSVAMNVGAVAAIIKLAKRMEHLEVRSWILSTETFL